jgi:hypothetical protein
MNTKIDPRFNVLLENVEYNSFAIELAEVIQDMLESEDVSAGEKGRWLSLKGSMLTVTADSDFIDSDWLQSELDFWCLDY